MKELKSAERRFAKAEEKWMRHQQVDMPEFRQWYHRVLGPLEQEMNRYQSEFALYETFLNGLGQEGVIQGRPVRDLLAELLSYAKAHDNGRKENHLYGDWSPAFLMDCGCDLWLEPRERKRKEQQERRQPEPEGRRTNPQGNGSESLDDWMRDLFAELEMGEEFFSGVDPDGNFWGERDSGFEAPLPKNDANEQEFRSLYRTLCRALHPDISGESSAETLPLWLEVQEAYESHDLERMEALYASWELKMDPKGTNSPCSRIMMATRDCLAGLRALQRNLRKARKDMSWQFTLQSETVRTDRAAIMIQEMKRELHGMEREMQDELREFRRVLKAAHTPKKRKINREEFLDDGGLFGDIPLW